MSNDEKMQQEGAAEQEEQPQQEEALKKQKKKDKKNKRKKAGEPKQNESTWDDMENRQLQMPPPPVPQRKGELTEEQIKRRAKKSIVWRIPQIPQEKKQIYAEFEVNPNSLVIANLPVNVTSTSLQEYFINFITSLNEDVYRG